MNRPSVSVRVVLAPCGPVAVTVTPGTGSPCASTTRPAIVPVVSCAAARAATEQSMTPTISARSEFTHNLLRNICIQVSRARRPAHAGVAAPGISVADVHDWVWVGENIPPVRRRPNAKVAPAVREGVSERRGRAG